ncbi:MAG: TnsA-like heteromeric transposase endonuclease subunit [Gaiellaceae bacterium]
MGVDATLQRTSAEARDLSRRERKPALSQSRQSRTRSRFGLADTAFELSHVDGSGKRATRPLVDAAHVAFQVVSPIRGSEIRREESGSYSVPARRCSGVEVVDTKITQAEGISGCVGRMPGADRDPPTSGDVTRPDRRSLVTGLELDAVEISYRERGGAEVRRPLREAVHIPFHQVEPVRGFPAYRRQRHMSGFYWFATTARFVAYESRLELSILMLLDYDLEVEAVAAQPFHLRRRGRNGRQLGHVPDYFALLAGGRGRVIDVTPAARRHDPARKLGFELTTEACRSAGWEYAIKTELNSTLLTNLRALSGFRREPAGFDRFACAVLSGCAKQTTIGSLLAAEVGPDALVRPVMLHLLWQQRLKMDLAGVLSNQTLIAAVRAGASAG